MQHINRLFKFGWLGLIAVLLMPGLVLPAAAQSPTQTPTTGGRGQANQAQEDPADPPGDERPPLPDDWQPEYLFTFDAAGRSGSPFPDGRYVAVAPDGTVYVGMFENNTIYKFDKEGNYESAWLVEAEAPLQDVEVDQDGNVYATAQSNLFKFDADGNLIALIESDFLNDINYQRLEIMPDGTLLIAEYFWDDGGSLYHLNPDGSAISPPQYGYFMAATGREADMFDQFTLAADGSLYYASYSSFEDSIVYRISLEGEVERQYKEIWTAMLTMPVAVDAYGNLLTGGQGSVHVYAPNGVEIQQIDLPASGQVHDLALTADGRLYVVQSEQAHVYQYLPR